MVVFLFKQKTAYELRISDWSSDVCSSDLLIGEIDAVAASPRLAVEVEVGADIIADIGDRDDRPETALVAGLLVGDGPDGIVMVARVDRVDGDDRPELGRAHV